jgi:hypothetical protein
MPLSVVWSIAPPPRLSVLATLSFSGAAIAALNIVSEVIIDCPVVIS